MASQGLAVRGRATSGGSGLGDAAHASFLSGVAVESAKELEVSTPDRDQVLLEHLPTVRYLARRIHERLPQHVEVDDLISAGVVGLIDAFSNVRSHQEGAV